MRRKEQNELKLFPTPAAPLTVNPTPLAGETQSPALALPPISKAGLIF